MCGELLYVLALGGFELKLFAEDPPEEPVVSVY
jgi:hypothetical protein